MSNEAPGAPATAAPSTSELPPASAAPVDGGVVDPSAQPADPAAPAAGEGEQPPATPPHRQAQPRFAELSRQIREEREARLRLEGENEALRRLAQPQSAQPAATPQPEAPTGPVRPDPTDRARYPLGDIDPQYGEDMAEYKAEVKVAEALAKLDKQAQEAAANQAFESRVETVAEAAIAAGFPEGAELLRSAPPAPEVREFIEDIMSAKNSGHVAAYFAKHNDQLRVVAALPIRERIRAIDTLDNEIGRRLAARPAPSPPAPASDPSAQPAPATPALSPTPVISGAGGAAPIGPPPENDPVAYRAWRDKAFG